MQTKNYYGKELQMFEQTLRNNGGVGGNLHQLLGSLEYFIDDEYMPFFREIAAIQKNIKYGNKVIIHDYMQDILNRGHFCYCAGFELDNVIMQLYAKTVKILKEHIKYNGKKYITLPKLAKLVKLNYIDNKSKELFMKHIVFINDTKNISEGGHKESVAGRLQKYRMATIEVEAMLSYEAEEWQRNNPPGFWGKMLEFLIRFGEGFEAFFGYFRIKEEKRREYDGDRKQSRFYRIFAS